MIIAAEIPIKIRRNDTSRHTFTMTNIADDGTRLPFDLTDWVILGQAKHTESSLFFEFPITKIDAVNGKLGFSITKAIGETLLPLGSGDSITVPYEIQGTINSGTPIAQTGTFITGTFEVIADLVEDGRMKSGFEVDGFIFRNTQVNKITL